MAAKNMQRSSDNGDEIKHFMARQSTAKDLPTFSGDPEEWLNFISQFRRSTEVCGFSQSENMYRLQKCLKGKAREAVQAMMVLPENTDEVIRTLELNFGRPDYVVKVLIDKVTRSANIREDKFEMLIELSNLVKNLVMTMETLKCTGHLNNPLMLEGLIRKLPPSLRLRWGEHAATMTEYANLKDFSSWISAKAIAASFISTPTFTSTDDNKEFGKRVNKKGPNRETVLTTSDNSSKKKSTENNCAFCDLSNHVLPDCPEFLNMDVEQRWKHATENKMCFSCLKTGHRTFRCFKKSTCGKDGCNRRHHQVLHKTMDETTPVAAMKEEVVINTFQQERPDKIVLLRMAPVKIRGPAGEISTYALFDEASTVTLLDQSLADSIGVTGPRDSLNLRWTNSSMKQEFQSNRVTIDIESQDGDSLQLTDVRTVKNLDLPVQSINVKKLSDKWTYLNMVKIDSMAAAKATILIGQDNIDLIIAREVIDGPKNAPVISRTKLGWILHGNVPAYRNRIDEITLHIHNYDEETDVQHQLVKDFKTDTFGVKVNIDRPISIDEQRAQELTERFARRIGDRWEVGLLWKEDAFLPHSKPNAMKRLISIEKKMDKEPNFAKRYCEKIQDYLTKGYAKQLSFEEVMTTTKTWYQPHFAVLNHSKPVKFRMVFDAAGKSNYVSLNDALLQGSDLLKSLIDVLFRFRQRDIGFCADIEELSQQVRIRCQDSSVQRFLWRGMDRSREPDIQEMVMIFRPLLSPHPAQEIKVQIQVTENFHISLITAKSRVAPLRTCDCLHAEKLCFNSAQGDSFPEELRCLTNGKPIKLTSRIVPLSPTLCINDLIRIRRRTSAASEIDEWAKNPVILDTRHPFTKLLIKHFHEQAGHHGKEHVMSELRQKYWVLNMRSAIRRTWNSCQLCKNLRARPQVTEMAPLLAIHLEAYVRPFTSSGIDYFGPIEVTIGRRRKKRHGVIFTCTRAVHLEMAASLNTDSAIMDGCMDIRRMIARRGRLKKIYSDNGTNLQGSDKELRMALRELDQTKIVTEMTIRNIEWHFITPATPHMGGSWERLVRSVKTSLKATLNQQAPKEEVLQTLLLEAEHVVKSSRCKLITGTYRRPVARQCVLEVHENYVDDPGESSREEECWRGRRPDNL